jgi:hypothetical protein
LSTGLVAKSPTQSGFTGGPPQVLVMIADVDRDEVWMHVVIHGADSLVLCCGGGWLVVLGAPRRSATNPWSAGRMGDPVPTNGVRRRPAVVTRASTASVTPSSRSWRRSLGAMRWNATERRSMGQRATRLDTSRSPDGDVSDPRWPWSGEADAGTADIDDEERRTEIGGNHDRHSGPPFLVVRCRSWGTTTMPDPTRPTQGN